MHSIVLAFSLFCLLPKLALSQYEKSTLQLQRDSLLTTLRQHGIDTICVYESYCVGCRGFRISEDSPCRTKGILIPTYLFWQQNGNNYGRKLDNCSIGGSKKLSLAAFWPYLLKYQHQIAKEKIKQFVNMNHGGEAAFDFYIKADTISQYFSTINLAKRIKHPRRKNQYYRHNTHTHTAHLQRLLEESIVVEFPESN